jgi:hypothetical protein
VLKRKRASRYALAAQDGGELAVHGGKVRGIYKNEYSTRSIPLAAPTNPPIQQK